MTVPLTVTETQRGLLAGSRPRTDRGQKDRVTISGNSYAEDSVTLHSQLMLNLLSDTIVKRDLILVVVDVERKQVPFVLEQLHLLVYVLHFKV